MQDPFMALICLAIVPEGSVTTEDPAAVFQFLFFYFWLRWVFVAVGMLSLVAASGGYSSLRCMGFSLRWLFLLRRTGSRRVGFSSCGT